MSVTGQPQPRFQEKASPAGSPNELVAVIAGHAERTPSAPALLGPSGDVASYAGLHEALHELIRQVRAAGVREHDRVVVAADSDLAGAILSLAVLGSAVCVPVSGTWSPDELRDYLELVGPRAVIAAGTTARRVLDAAGALAVPAFGLELPSGRPVMRAVPSPAGRDGPTAPPRGRLSVRPADALLLRTSGTTAAGKVAAITIGQALAAARATVRAYHLGPADRRLNVMPLHHVQGLVGSLIATMSAGGSIVLLPHFDARLVLLAFQSSAPTWFSGTPTMHRALLDAMPPGFGVPSSLRFVRCGSGALRPELRAEIARRWRVPVVESYGMSEAHQIASTPLPPTAAAVALVAAGSTVGVLGEDGVPRTAAGSGPGELVVRGGNVISHYAWPPGQQDAFIDDWLRTGDLGQLMPDGSVRVIGRVKELINAGGEKFSPAEVEAALAAHPEVRDVVAFAIPDPRYGERAAAIVVPHPGCTPAEDSLLSFAAQRVAAIKVPRWIVRMEAIPVAENGKVVRSELARQVVAELARAERAAPGTGPRPRNAIEATLAGLWATALDRAAVPVTGDFVALGGDSLSAVTLLSMVSEIFAVEISPAELFDTVATIASMAEWIARAKGAGQPGPATAPAETETR